MTPFEVTQPSPERELLERNVSGGLNGPQPWPGGATDSSADGVVDVQQLLSCVNRAPDVQRSYSETAGQAFSGTFIDNYGACGGGAPLPDQTLGPSRNGYRGMADEPLPVRPPAPDCDGDYDNDDNKYLK